MKEATVTDTRTEIKTKSEYSVEFECYAKFLVYFEAESNLTDRQIIASATKIAEGALGPGGSVMIERTSREGSYAITALGVDRSSAHIMGKPLQETPRLRVVK